VKKAAWSVLSQLPSSHVWSRVHSRLCFVHNPRKKHWSVLKHILCYIKETINYGIIYKTEEDLNPIRYIDLDYAEYKDTK